MLHLASTTVGILYGFAFFGILHLWNFAASERSGDESAMIFIRCHESDRESHLSNQREGEVPADS